MLSPLSPLKAPGCFQKAPKGASRFAVYDGRVSIELGRPTDRRPPFKFAAYTRVGFSDTDAQGIVYYGRYLPYFDFARVEYHRHLGLLVTDRGEHDFVMRAASVLYEAPARFDDLLEEIGRASCR